MDSHRGGELQGRVALVTGGSRNIGRAICEELAAAGAEVIVNARSSLPQAEEVVDAIRAAGGQAHAMLADVGVPAEVDAMMQAVTERLGRLDVIVNCAAPRHEAPFKELGYEDWKATLATVLDGAFLTVKAALPLLVRSSGAAIVNVSGMSAYTGARNRVHNGSAKAGLLGLTRALAVELAADGITVNCVVPGFIDTVRRPGGEHRPPDASVLERLPFKERTPPQEVAGMVRHLCGTSCRHVTGQVFHINGGVYLGA